MSLYASTQDLALEGIRAAATASVASSRLRMLQTASNKADSYLRGRYTLPLVADIGTVEQVPATGSTGTGMISAAITAGSTVVQAYGVKLEVVTTGASGAATARISTDGGTTWQATFTINNGTQVVVLSGAESITLTITDPGAAGWFIGDVYYVPVSYGALTTHVVNMASWMLLGHRGVDSDGAGYDYIRTAYKDALKWLEGARDNKIDPGLIDATPNVHEESFVFEPDLDSYEAADRDWDQVLGRTSDTGEQVTW